jgi:Transposase domain (DUF772)
VYRDRSDLLRSTVNFCEGRVAPDSIYGVLHRECFNLFPDEMFADLFTDVGRRSVPPMIVGVVMVLQRLEGLSDREAVERFAFDARWRHAKGHHHAGDDRRGASGDRWCASQGAGGPDGLLEGRGGRRCGGANGRLRAVGQPLWFRPGLVPGRGSAQSKGIVEHLCGYAQSDLVVPLVTEARISGVPISVAVANAGAAGWCVEVNAAVHSEIAAVARRASGRRTRRAGPVAVAAC